MSLRDFMVPGRSVALGGSAMAASSHPLATMAAIDILKAGGTAADAALAAVALQGVIDPHMTGIGGDCFALYAPAGRDPVAVNGSGPAPHAIDPEALAARGEEIDDGSADAVTIPGAVGAWGLIAERWGRLGLDRVLAPAIEAAETGYVITPRVALDWDVYSDRLRRHEAAARQFLPDGKPPLVGDRLRDPALAETLRRIGAEGPRAFYEGFVAEDMVATLRAAGGVHDHSDFSAYKPEICAPISAAYGDRTLVECPPNGQGLTALIIARILDGYDQASMTEADRIHLLAEATKSAYGLRDALIADPAHMTVTPEELLSDKTIGALRTRIDMARASEGAAPDWPEHRDTVYVTVVDAEGNAMSLINSVFHAFGSGIYAPGAGVLFQNRGFGFSLRDGHPNRIAPGKRPFHTIIPAMVMSGDLVEMCLGVMGGAYQPVGHAQILTGVYDLGLDVQAASDRPRSFWRNGALDLEPTVPEEVAADLAARGHRINRVTEPLGACQTILIDRTRKVLWGASDHRKDGVALGY